MISSALTSRTAMRAGLKRSCATSRAPSSGASVRIIARAEPQQNPVNTQLPDVPAPVGSTAPEPIGANFSNTPPSAPSPQETPKTYSFGDAMSFAGPAPEVINGRLAMLGFVAGVGAELATGQPILSQFGSHPVIVAGTFGLFIAASLIPLLSGADRKQSVGPLTPRAELLNGQVAMLGFASMLILEALNGKPLF